MQDASILKELFFYSATPIKIIRGEASTFSEKPRIILIGVAEQKIFFFSFYNIYYLLHTVNWSTKIFHSL